MHQEVAIPSPLTANQNEKSISGKRQDEVLQHDAKCVVLDVTFLFKVQHPQSLGFLLDLVGGVSAALSNYWEIILGTAVTFFLVVNMTVVLVRVLCFNTWVIHYKRGGISLF